MAPDRARPDAALSAMGGSPMQQDEQQSEQQDHSLPRSKEELLARIE
jgi:hypothetical protein